MSLTRMTPAVDHLAQLRAMLTFERSLVDRVGPPGCAARETAAANVAALEWVLERIDWPHYAGPASEGEILAGLRRHRELLDAEIESVSATIRQYQPNRD